jgi:DNA-binding transcriptional MerR regulator
LQRCGLLPPLRRYGRSDHVAFHHAHLERLHAVRRGLLIGFDLDELRAILGVSGHVTCNDIYAIAQSAIKRLHREGLDETKLWALMEASPRTGSKLNSPIYLEIVGPRRQRSPRGGRRLRAGAQEC